VQVSLFQPFVPGRLSDTEPFARVVAENSGLSRFWMGQSWTVDPVATCVHLAAVGIRVPTGIGVLVTSARHPVHAALEARTLAVATGHVPEVAFGPGSRDLQRDLLGAPLHRPVSDSVAFLSEVARELGVPTSERTTGTRGYPVRLPLSDAPAPRLGLGVLRPRMAVEAGRSADSAVLWSAPPGYIEHTIVPALDRGADAAGRPRPRVIVIVPTVPQSSGVAEPVAIDAALGGHLRLPHYRDMLQRAAVDLGSTPEHAVAGLLRSDAVLRGHDGDVAEGLRRFAEAGVDEVVLNLSGVHLRGGATAICRALQGLTRVIGTTHEPVDPVEAPDICRGEK
jgi:5,10-methylenetetrahydromethanopterin reductase